VYLLCALALSTFACAGGVVSSEDGTGSTSEDITQASVVSRAESWVGDRLQYCQSANHQRDYDSACSTYCNRTNNAQWDPYRSDCSGLVSFAWGLPAPGRVTTEFAPFMNDISHAISVTSLRPGDAVNNADHVMLFKQWVTQGSKAIFIEEPGCSTAINYAHEFETTISIVSDQKLYVPYNGMTFTAIRFDGITANPTSTCTPGGRYCGGDKIGGDSNTLYQCNASSSPTVLEQCADGCQVSSGGKDSCKVTSGACVQGQMYCGGHELGGDPSTLYQCNGSAAPSVVEHCSAGCIQSASGQGDSCGGSGGPAVGGRVATNADGRLEAFYLGTDTQIHHLWQSTAGGTWTQQHSLGGDVISDPVVLGNADGRLEVFAVGANHAVETTWQTSPGGGWYSWYSLGGDVVGELAVGRHADGRLALFGRGADNALWYTAQTAANGKWYSWVSLGGSLSSSPAVGVDAYGRLEVFALNAAGSVAHIGETQGGWSSWSDTGLAGTGQLATGQDENGSLRVFAVGTDHALHTAVEAGANAQLGTWSSLGGSLASAPAVVRNTNKRLELFAEASNGMLYHLVQTTPNGGFGTWASFQDTMASSPSVGTDKDGRFEVFSKGTNGDIQDVFQSSGFASGWSPDINLGGQLASF
jgi:hypothetical protein